MIIKEQQHITIVNCCNAIYDSNTLRLAILWFTNKPVYRVKTVFMYGKYPSVSIYDRKIHIRRLIMMYKMQCDIPDGYLVHHSDGNGMNSGIENLLLMEISAHQSLHNKGKTLSDEHKAKIGKASKAFVIIRDERGRIKGRKRIHEEIK